MKTQFVLKILLVLPVILFFDFVLMVLLGCATCLFGLGNDFYCGPYCIFGKVILGLSALFFLLLLFPDLINLLKILKNATTTKK